jgi:uncharacterized protein YjbI with pentapeptide repeats
MKFEIKNRYSGAVMFSIEGETWKIAFEAAVKSKQSFDEADLSEKDFSGVEIEGGAFARSSFDGSSFDGSSFDGSSFDGSSFVDSSFARSSFARSSFVDSSFARSSFVDSSFARSSFARSSFVDSSFARSSFVDSSFARSSFVDSSFDGSSFDGSSFVDSSFARSSFDGSSFVDSSFARSSFVDSSFDGSSFESIPAEYKNQVRDDLWAVLSAAPNEVEGLRKALAEGRVNGSTYQGACACLVGTIANVRGCDYRELGILQPNSNRLAELWFISINKGNTPDDNPFSRLALEWVDQWLVNVRAAFGPKPEPIVAQEAS